MYHSRIFLSVGGSVWYMIRNLRCTVTIDSVLANSKTQNTFLFTVNAIFRHDCPLAVEPGSTPRPLVQKKLGEILNLLICSFLPCLSWLLCSRVRKSRRDLWITLYISKRKWEFSWRLKTVGCIVKRKWNGFGGFWKAGSYGSSQTDNQSSHCGLKYCKIGSSFKKFPAFSGGITSSSLKVKLRIKRRKFTSIVAIWMRSEENSPKNGEPTDGFSFTTMLQHTGRLGQGFLS